MSAAHAAARTQLLRLGVRDFRNLANLEFTPCSRFNVIAGENGQGKSNLLEAIDYLGNLRSFRGATTEELHADGVQSAELLASVGGDVFPHQHRVLLSRAGARRQVQLDGKRPQSRASYAQAMPVVLFHPGDLELTTGSAEPRRSFLDDVLQRLDATYDATRTAYDKALSSRNRLLKDTLPQKRAIVAYDELLASAGAIIGQARDSLLLSLAPRVADAFAQISGDAAEVTLRYEPKTTPEVSELRAALAAAYDKDVARGFTGVGPHTDEVVFRLQQHKARRYASQGQHRAIVLALKVAELLELERRAGRTPILLLDDVSSELDPGRNRRFFSLLGKLGGQVFLTTTAPELILVEQDRQDYRMREGQLERA